MDMTPFNLDIDELVNEFAEAGSTTLAEMKRIWLLKKFTFIFESSPSSNQACFMQSLYAHCIGYIVSTRSFSHRVGGLYCLYCLYETQPFRPPFKIYLSLGELRQLKNLVADARLRNIKIVSALVKRILEKNLFLFGFVDINEGSATERINELTDVQNARIQMAYKKLFSNTRIEHFMHMDLGTELDVDFLKKISTDYAMVKDVAITEASKVMDVENIKHLTQNKRPIGDAVEKTAGDWNLQKELFYQQTRLGRPPAEQSSQQEEHESHEGQRQVETLPQVASNNNHIQEGTQEANDDFGKELEMILSQPFQFEDEEMEDIEQQDDDGNFGE